MQYSAIMSKNKFIFIVGCQGVVQLGGLVSRYYRVIPPRWGLVSSILDLYLFTNNVRAVLPGYSYLEPFINPARVLIKT